MTPKEQYEARKAERQARIEQEQSKFERENIESQDLLDRAVTAMERIADALEGKVAKPEPQPVDLSALMRSTEGSPGKFSAQYIIGWNSALTVAETYIAAGGKVKDRT